MEPTLPALKDLDTWLADREAKIPGLRPGTAAGVVWAGKQTRTAVSIIYLHGYTATRGEIYPVPDKVAATLGANLFYARLTGHGTSDGHRTATAEDWVNDTREALAIGQLLGDKVAVMATSTGGTLAVLEALGKDPFPAAAMILVSPNLTVKNSQMELLLWPGKHWLLKTLVGDEISAKGSNDLHAQYWDLTHHSHSLIPLMELVNRARKQDFRRWPYPTLVIYDPEDSTVDEAVTEKLFKKAPSDKVTQLKWKTLPGESNHVIAGEALSPGSTEPMIKACVDYLRQVLNLT